MMNTTDDLFGMLEPDPRWDPVPSPKPTQKRRSEPLDQERNGAIVECEISGGQYRIERHTHKKDADDSGDDASRAFWKVFIRDANTWRRMTLLGPDAKIIPPDLLYRAEQMLPWAAGGMDRCRESAAKLRPPVKEEPDFDPDTN